MLRASTVQPQAVSTKTAIYTATAQDAVIYADTTGGAFTITLPAANANGNGIAVTCRIIRKDNSANALTISRAGADTFIDASTSTTIAGFSTKRFVSDSVSKWSLG